MTFTDIDARLEEIRHEVHQRYEDEEGLHGPRLAQFDGALSTVGMCIAHLADEDVRHRHNPIAHRKALGAYVRED